jgi:hypothetical protein
MKSISLVSVFAFFLLFMPEATYAQRFGWAQYCHRNVMDQSLGNSFRDGVIRASFKMLLYYEGSGSGLCSGTLINRNTSKENLGYYILTSRHCLTGDKAVDFGREHFLYFNYQSPSYDNGSTVKSNKGKSNLQSTSNTDPWEGYEFVSSEFKVWRYNLKLATQKTVNVYHA